ncbi:dATP/dGTP diphosphohydrolase domain-containing protein [Streptomyces sp. MMS24-I29]|uniref:dATP/dGTP diphosphohydrolase domain-containing protein n=1 Tax=Streptomyces sp. MMS24-I29 TaxID=3351480 RepID=UPI003C7ADC25
MTPTAFDTAPYETKDSGHRGQYASGMLREPDTGRPRFDLLVPENVPYGKQLLTRCAALMARGAEKYESRNWEKADSREELDRMKASAFRHFMQWLTGETEEDHAAAVVFNLLAAESTAYAIGQKHTAVGNDRAVQDPV